ncbi:MAG: FG-GAP repeat domain-containing protein [Planctomycetota bacterium]
MIRARMVLFVVIGGASVAPVTGQQFRAFAFPAFAAMLPSPTPLKIWPALGDVDGDGRNDLVLLSDHAVSVGLSNGDGTYAMAHTATPRVYNNYGWGFCDIDHDGDQDLVVADHTFQHAEAVRILANSGAALAEAQVVQVGMSFAGFHGLGLVDVDGDGWIDVLAQARDGLLLLQNQGGVLGAPTLLGPGLGATANADFDGDGDQDLMWSEYDRFGIALNDGTGRFPTRVTIDSGYGTTVGVAAGIGLLDLEGDGDLDLFVANLGVFRNNGGLSFSDYTLTSIPRLPYRSLGGSMALSADYDADGDDDVLLTWMRNGTNDGQPVVLLLNDGAGVFRDRTSLLAGATRLGSAIQVTLGDVDDDGDTDILVDSGTQLAPIVFANHVRQCVLTAPLRLGQTGQVLTSTVPIRGLSGDCWLVLAPAPSPTPVPLPGIAGPVLIDLGTSRLFAVVPWALSGAQSVGVPVPAVPALQGGEVWFQFASIPDFGTSGAPLLSNAIRAVVGP